MERTQEFISSSFWSRSRRVALLRTWSTATCTARQRERTEQSTERVQMAAWPAVAVAEIALEEAAAEGVDHVADGDRLGGAGEGVAAFLAARGFDESALAQHAQELGGVGRRRRLRPG